MEFNVFFRMDDSKDRRNEDLVDRLERVLLSLIFAQNILEFREELKCCIIHIICIWKKWMPFLSIFISQCNFCFHGFCSCKTASICIWISLIHFISIVFIVTSAVIERWKKILWWMMEEMSSILCLAEIILVSKILVCKQF